MKPTVSPTPDNEEDNTDLKDEIPFKKQNDELDDQSQYDPDLDKQTKSGTDSDSTNKDVEATDSSEEESLFEVSQLKKFLK